MSKRDEPLIQPPALRSPAVPKTNLNGDSEALRHMIVQMAPDAAATTGTRSRGIILNPLKTEDRS